MGNKEATSADQKSIDLMRCVSQFSRGRTICQEKSDEISENEIHGTEKKLRKKKLTENMAQAREELKSALLVHMGRLWGIAFSEIPDGESLIDGNFLYRGDRPISDGRTNRRLCC